MSANISSNSKNLRRSVYAAGLFLTLTSSLVSYINSSFLASLINEKWVGIIYILASVITIGSFFYLPILISKIDLKKILLWLAIITTTSILVIGLVSKPAIIILGLFIFYYVTGALLRYSLDLYLETTSSDKLTGGIRGLFLTAINFAWLISPFLAGLLLDGHERYQIVYLGAAIAGLPLIFLIFYGLKPQKISSLNQTSKLGTTITELWQAKTGPKCDIRNIIAIDLILNFFYALMVVYTPIYLHLHLGFSWDEIGIIFTIMLLPFILLNYPIGFLADKKIGEKEILIVGLLVMAGATISLSFVWSSSLLVWALIMFLSRVGAASVETAKEIYLFKKIDSGDTSVLSLSRMMISFSYIIGPAFATIFLTLFDFRFIFVGLGLITLTGLIFATALTDTK